MNEPWTDDLLDVAIGREVQAEAYDLLATERQPFPSSPAASLAKTVIPESAATEAVGNVPATRPFLTEIGRILRDRLRRELTFSWVRDLPEWYQAIVWGFGMAVPLVALGLAARAIFFGGR